MASYSEKYYFSFNTAGVSQRLSIECKDYNGSASSLDGLLQSIRLTRQGDELLESPIVKSALTINLVDRDGGMWEEFFTPDSTKYRVSLSADGAVRWCGFITPDSYEEDLTYCGSISITARDMVGHMADIPFEEDFATFRHMATIGFLINHALQLAECAMSLDFTATGDREYMESDMGVGVASWVVDVRACEGKNWYEVIEGLLDSLGLVMRWEETGCIVVTSIRDLPCGGNTYDADNVEHDIQFWDVSGHRTLEPAYRMIDEVLTYDLFDGDTSEWSEDAFNGNDELSGHNGWYQAEGKRIAGKYTRDTSPEEYADVSAENENDYTLLAAVSNFNQGVGTSMSRSFPMSPFTKCKFSFELARTYDKDKNLVWEDAKGMMPYGTLEYQIKWVMDDATFYLTDEGTWSSEEAHLTIGEASTAVVVANVRNFAPYSTISEEREFTTPSEAGYVLVTINPLKHLLKLDTGTTEASFDHDLYYVRMSNVRFEIDPDTTPKELRVKTTYDEAQNYTLNRKPMFGKTPQKVTHLGVVLNGFYDETTGESIQEASIGSGSSLPLPVVVDMEILSRHLQTTSLLSGTIAPSGGEMARMSARWYRGERMFILQGGSLDPVRNCIEGATLREFTTGNSWTTDNYEIK